MENSDSKAEASGSGATASVLERLMQQVDIFGTWRLRLETYSSVPSAASLSAMPKPMNSHSQGDSIPSSTHSFTCRSKEMSIAEASKMKYIAVEATSESGSQFYRDMLDSGNVTSQNYIANVVHYYLFELMDDQYGSRLFCKLIQKDKLAKLEITEKILSSPAKLIQLSKTQYGSLSVLMFMRELKESQVTRMVARTLATEFYTLMTHRTGKEVIFECFNLLKHYGKEPFSEAAVKYCIELATDKVGCRSLNHIIDMITGPNKSLLLRKIAENSVCLAMDGYGNYVLQTVLDLKHPKLTRMICSKLHGTYIVLSCQKSGSHIVEKCLSSGGRNFVIDEFKCSPALAKLACNEFGNYVIQTALRQTKCADNESHQCLLQILEPHMQEMALHPKGIMVHDLIRNWELENKYMM